MAIGRVAGPMLLQTLDRQGVPLDFVTDPGTGNQTLLYLDFANFRMGVNTSVTSERLTVDGNISVNAYIKTTHTNQNLYLDANGAGQTVISNVNVLKGNINSTDIGTTIPSKATFTTANTTSKATFNTAQVQNLTPGRIVFSDGTGLNDDGDLLYFTSNNTLYATSIESAGTVGYANLNITGELLYAPTGTPTNIPFFAANSMFMPGPGIRYFSGNATFRANSLEIGSQVVNRVMYTSAGNSVVGSATLTFDGSTFTSNGITRLANLLISNQSITGINSDADIVISPNGIGVLTVQSHRISDIAEPTQPSDAATKQYVDDRISVSSVNTIAQLDSFVRVLDDGLTVANVEINVNGTRSALFTDTFNYIGDFSIYNNALNTVAGEILLIPANNNRIDMQTSTAVKLPTGQSVDRPLIPLTGDLRFNLQLSTIEWYDGTTWTAAAPANTIFSQPIIPDGVSNIFTLSQLADTDSVLININGTVQQPGAYTVVGTTLTFTEVPLATDIIEVRFLAAALVYASNPIFINDNYSNVTVSGTTVDMFYVTQYRSAIYTFTAQNTNLARYQTGEVFLVHNNITANAVASVKSTVGTAINLINWSTAIDAFGAVTLVATATSGTGTTQLKLSRTYFNDN